MKKSDNVAITGLGVVSPNGNHIQDFWSNCQKGQRGITNSPRPFFNTTKLRTPFWGQVTQIQNPADNSIKETVYRNRLLATLAADEAMADAGLNRSDILSLGTRTALSIGSLSYDDYHILEAAKYQCSDGADGSLKYLAKLSDFASYMKDYCGVGGVCYNFSAACASGSTAIGIGTDLIRFGQCDVVLVCGVDSLSPMVAYGFHSLKALSSSLCHPLDENRDGINIGEGCGFLVLESLSHAQNRQAEIYAECAGSSLGNEAFHITSPNTDASGFLQSMRTAVNDAGLTPEDIQYINLHGTGTITNDQIELQALKQLYNHTSYLPYFSSLKTLIGHCMGAAGALEAILTILCLKKQQYFPIMDVNAPMKEMDGCPMTPPDTPIQYALSNSFAFAGNTASVIFQRHIPPDNSCSQAASNITDAAEHSILSDVWINGLGILSPAITDADDWWMQLSKTVSEEKEGRTPAATPTPGISVRKLRGVNHLSRMVLSASLQAEQDSGCDHTLWDSNRVGTFYSSGFGPVSKRLQFGQNVAQEEPDLCNPTVFANISPNAPVGHLCINMNCKGASSSLHGSSPLLLSVMQILSDRCDTVLSCTAEEYHPLLAESLFASGIIQTKDYDESSITILLQKQQSASSYCRLETVQSCDLSQMEHLPAVPYMPDIIFMQKKDRISETREKSWLAKIYPDPPMLSTEHITGKFLNNSLHANIVLAAICLQKNMLPPQWDTDTPPIIQRILVTGYDVCDNYHQILLCSKERRSL